MKKLSILLIASVAMLSCGNSYKIQKVNLETMNDSLNYVVGMVNGDIIQGRLLDHTPSGEEIAEILEAIDNGYSGKLPTLTRAEEIGVNFASYVKGMEKEGINSNPNWYVNEGLLFQGFVNGLHRDTLVITRAAAEQYITDKYQATPENIEGVTVRKPKTAKCVNKVKNVTLKTEVDSINYVLGYLNGEDIYMYVIAQSNTVEDDTKGLIDNINKTMKLDYVNPDLVKMSENFGKQLATSSENGFLGIQTLETNLDLIKKGMINGLLGDTVVMTAPIAQNYLNTTMHDLESAQAKAGAEDRIAAEEAFLAENAQRAEVVVTESGLQYEVLKKGNGKKPLITDKVKVHYHGTLLDGTVFDSSVERGEPIDFALTQVIAGWTEGLQLMPVGSKYKFYIPYQLGYGERPAGQIPPYSMLIFEVELLGIE